MKTSNRHNEPRVPGSPIFNLTDLQQIAIIFLFRHNYHSQIPRQNHMALRVQVNVMLHFREVGEFELVKSNIFCLIACCPTFD